eukprot:10894068-Alexandrium_andersonii.AAC.1
MGSSGSARTPLAPGSALAGTCSWSRSVGTGGSRRAGLMARRPPPARPCGRSRRRPASSRRPFAGSPRG